MPTSDLAHEKEKKQDLPQSATFLSPSSPSFDPRNHSPVDASLTFRPGCQSWIPIPPPPVHPKAILSLGTCTRPLVINRTHFKRTAKKANGKKQIRVLISHFEIWGTITESYKTAVAITPKLYFFFLPFRNQAFFFFCAPLKKFQNRSALMQNTPSKLQD